ncbi:MAG: anthranilate phosphoribosyltransferase [Gemmataceae bacterium]
MNIQNLSSYFRNIIENKALDETLALELFRSFLENPEPEAVFGAFLFSLADHGFSPDFLSNAADALLQKGNSLGISPVTNAMDTCGTGGDYSSSFNVSTTVAFVLAAGGVPIVKHGNRAASGKSGSADVLIQLGIPMDVSMEDLATCFQKEKICFCFAPAFYPFLKNIAPIRKQLGFKTIFNFVGPLVNPARVRFHLLGVGRNQDLDLYSRALQKMGKSGIVLCGGGRVDEAVLDSSTEIRIVKPDQIHSKILQPEDFGLPSVATSQLAIDSVEASAKIILEVLSGKVGPASDVVMANAGLGFWGFGISPSLKEGVNLARSVLCEKKALNLYNRLRDFFSQK